jgi:hypothetical protein
VDRLGAVVVLILAMAAVMVAVLAVFHLLMHLAGAVGQVDIPETAAQAW